MHQFVAVRSQLVDTLACHVFEHALSAREQGNHHAPAIVAASSPPDVPVGLEPVDQFYDTVVFERETLGQNADGGFFTLGKTAYHQQQQILLGLEPRRTRRGVAFAQKMTDATAKLGQRAIFFRCDFGGHL